MASTARVIVLTPLPRNLVLIETVELPPRPPRDDAPRTPRRRSPPQEQPRRAGIRWPAIAGGIIAAFALFAGAKGAVTAPEVLAVIVAVLVSMAIVVRVSSARA
ncbi:MAG TPA: hypothetical protein VFB62_25210 [Polyangiaceae bacterium]|jgi:hypothetical protein|nr:hypothetical protein [Polyangiaceae bacterium]